MKKFIQKIASLMVVAVASIGLISPVSTPVYAATPAANFGADAAILTTCANKEDGSGSGIKCVIELVVNILSVLVGIVGVIGVVIVGIQYLTAGGNEEQTRKAKRRLFEIIIGIVAYAAIYALIRFLLPNF